MRMMGNQINPVRRAILMAGVVAIAASAVTLVHPHHSALAAANDASSRKPVLVELFTSEGCSSCPPADALLARLDAQQFVPGAEAIVLSEHVTYWNHEGWEDPFSLEAVTTRQQQYGVHFGLESVYTPQAVVDGEAQVVGSDEAGLRRAIARAADAPALDVAIDQAERNGNEIRFKVREAPAQGEAHNASLVAALAVDSAQTSVARGENAGRTLRHVAVVRVMKDMGKDAANGQELTLKLPGGEGAQTGALRLVVFLADRRSGRVFGAAERTIAQ